jgi:hypothetical protein
VAELRDAVILKWRFSLENDYGAAGGRQQVSKTGERKNAQQGGI